MVVSFSNISLFFYAIMVPIHLFNITDIRIRTEHGSGAHTMKKFEERLARLEEISEKIKSADLPLEEALAAFEEGIKLAKTLEKDIDKIESKVQILMNQPMQPQDKPELELFSVGDV